MSNDTTENLLDPSERVNDENIVEDLNNNSDTYDDSLQCFIDFNPDDIIFEERIITEPLNIKELAVKCLFTVFSITLCVVLGTVLLCIPCIYFDLNFMNLCDGTKWNDLPKKIRWAHLFSHCFADHMFMFWYMINVCLVFPMDGIRTRLLIVSTVFAGCVCTIYRLSTYIFEIYGTSSLLGTPQYAIFLFTLIYTPWLVFSNESYSRVEKLKLYVIPGIVYLIVFLINYLNLFVILPTFLKTNSYSRLLMATLIPMIGFLARLVCRRILLSIKKHFHPGNLYILYSQVYAVTIMFYRMLQASVQSLNSFMLLGFIHALIGFLERVSSELYRRKITILLCRKLCRKEMRIETTLKEKRINADTVIIGIIYEVWGIIVTNCIFFLYTVQHKIPSKHDLMYHFTEQLVDILIRILYSVAMETIFVYFTVIILIIKVNIPINRIWRKQWRRFIMVLIINGALAIILTSKSLTSLTEQSYYKHLWERGDEELAKRLYMCNYTSYPYQ